jgi:hypothetical protein
MRCLQTLVRTRISTRMRITALSLTLYNLICLALLSGLDGRVMGVLLGAATVQMMVVGVAEFVRMDALLRNDDRPGKALFAFLLGLIAMWLVFNLYAIVFFSNSHHAAYSELLLTSLPDSASLGLNLLYFLPMLVAGAYYLRLWYRFFWVEYVSVIFLWIKEDMHRKNEELEARLSVY